MNRIANVVALFVLLVTAGFTQSSIAQDSADRCRTVADLMGRDQTGYTFNSAMTDYIYDQLCDDRQERSGIDYQSQASAVIDLVPIGGSSGLSGRKEKTRKFCSTHVKQSAANTSISLTQSIVVKEAIQAWQSCIALNDQVDINIKHNLGGSGFIVELSRGREDAVFQGIHLKQGRIECSTQVFEDGRWTNKTVDQNFSAPLTTSKLAVSCRRPVDVMPATEFSYLEQTTVDILTSRGSTSVTLARDARLGPIYASQLEDELRQTQANLADAVKRLKRRTPDFKNVCVKQNSCPSKHPACPSGWSEMFQNSNTWSGGPCGQGNVCTACFRMSD